MVAEQKQIDEMKERLRKRQIERAAERDMDEVVRMVQRNPFVQAPTAKTNDEIKLLIDSIVLFMLATFGAIYWNIASSLYGLMFFVVCMAFSCVNIKKARGIKHDERCNFV